MKAKRILASFIAMAMTMGMMSSLVLADESENAPGETSVVETTEPKEKETKKPAETKAEEPEEKKPVETSAADPEEKKPEETVKETEPTESEDKKPAEITVHEPSQTEATEPAESEKEEPSEPAETEPETTAVPENGKREDSHAVPPKNEQVQATSISFVSIKLDEPVIGAYPDYTAKLDSSSYYSESFSNEYYKNFICWLDVTTNSHMYRDGAEFEGEHEYQVVLFLTARDGYCFTTSTTAKVNDNNAKTSIDEEGHLRVAYNFSKLPKEITSVSITLDAPVAGAKPDYTALFPTGANYFCDANNEDYYRNDIRWLDYTTISDLNPDSDVFKAGHKYKVYVFLTPKDGYAFSIKENATTMVNGETANIHLQKSGQLMVEKIFKLEGEASDLINSVSITLDAPVVGMKPDYTAVFPEGANYYSAANNNFHYRNDIYWCDETVSYSSYLSPDDGVFKAGHKYKVVVRLTAKEGYGFSSSTTITLNGKNASASLSNNKLQVVFDYETLVGEATDIITSVSIKLDAPVIGARPDYEAEFPSDANYYSRAYDVGNFRNYILWHNDSTGKTMIPDVDVFSNGNKYQVSVWLNSKDGYSFGSDVIATVNGHSAIISSVFPDQLKIVYDFPVLNSMNIGDAATIDGNNYTITNNRTDGTGTVTLTGVSEKRATVSIPATVVISGYVYKVNRIGAKAFYGDKTLKTVNIGDDVAIIDANAFYGCSNLTKVSGGKALKTIGANAFARCPKLSSFVITSTVLSKIGTYAFNKDSKLKTISIKNTTKLTKSGVKKSLKGSKVKTVKVKKSKVKKYKKYFKKKNSGRSVKVKK